MLTFDSQCPADASRVENEGGCEAIKRSIIASRAGLEKEEGAVKRKLEVDELEGRDTGE